MRTIAAMALSLLLAAPLLAMSPAQRSAEEQLRRGVDQDRVADAARQLREGTAPSSSAVTDDMTRGSLGPERRDLLALPQGSAREIAQPPVADTVPSGSVDRNAPATR
ncbi:hypothetical protein ACE7GA_23805 [Roseomonas sp. CCTCC AB2023176]|uniref:hypothetical protein n=1 Tax=Roseomonas sp. CCTCC AB2023176 TaxID=3342640 RepID=UPI0035DAC30B